PAHPLPRHGSALPPGELPQGSVIATHEVQAFRALEQLPLEGAPLVALLLLRDRRWGAPVCAVRIREVSTQTGMSGATSTLKGGARAPSCPGRPGEALEADRTAVHPAVPLGPLLHADVAVLAHHVVGSATVRAVPRLVVLVVAPDRSAAPSGPLDAVQRAEQHAVEQRALGPVRRVVVLRHVPRQGAALDGDGRLRVARRRDDR